MGVSNYDITSADLRKDRRQDYELSILSGVDSFAYIIRDRSANRLLAYRSFDFDGTPALDWTNALTELIDQDANLHDVSYGKTVLGWDGDAVTLIPTPLFAPGSAVGYLEALTIVGLEDEVRHEALAPLDSHLVYRARQSHLQHFETEFSGSPARHHAGALLITWAARSRRLTHSAVSASIRGRRIFLAAHDKGNLLYFNTFHFTNSQDAIYYLLLAYDQGKLDPTRAPLYLCGEILTTGELYGQFYRYVEDIRFCQYGAPPAAAPELAELPTHLYFDLLCLK